jgi:hypothetical protein
MCSQKKLLGACVEKSVEHIENSTMRTGEANRRRSTLSAVISESCDVIIRINFVCPQVETVQYGQAVR